MADITKCHGHDCPIRNKCHRFTAQANEYWQSYLDDQPGKFVGRKFECEMFWDNGKDTKRNDKRS